MDPAMSEEIELGNSPAEVTKQGECAGKEKMARVLGKKMIKLHVFVRLKRDAVLKQLGSRMTHNFR
jgi:hypothetical protein